MSKDKYFMGFLILIVCGMIVFGYISYKNLKRLGKLKGLANALSSYAEDHEGNFPDFDKWSEILVLQGYCSKNLFSDTKLSYALNTQLEGTKYYEITDNTVVLFEAKGGNNLTGDYELVKQTSYPWPGCAMQFGINIDKVRFLKKDDAEKVNWEPIEINKE